MPRIVAIHLAPGSRLAMRSVDSAVIEAGAGIVDDRYHGTRHRHVSIQSLPSLAEGADRLGAPVDPALTRRNITIDEGTVPTRPGTRATIGDVVLEVVRKAAPCRLLDDSIGAGAARALHDRAGTIFRALEGGTVAVGDEVVFGPEPD